MANSLESSYDENLNLWKGYKFSYPYENNVFLGEKIIESLKSNENRLLQISHDENRELFAREFLTSIIRVAQNLTKIGIKSNDVIGIVCLNSISTSIIINASILIGAPVNPLDPLFTVDDICHMFKQT
jgi:4-coumarate--CoA ligase